MTAQQPDNRVVFRLLSEKQLNKIHIATLEILERTGVKVFDKEAQGLLKKAGAKIVDDNCVRIPSRLIKKALKSAPDKISVFNRDGEPAMLLKDRNVYYGTGSDCPNTIDPHTGERRAA